MEGKGKACSLEESTPWNPKSQTFVGKSLQKGGTRPSYCRKECLLQIFKKSVKNCDQWNTNTLMKK